MQKLKRGDICPKTGRLFWRYCKTGTNGEWWLPPDKFEELKIRDRAITDAYRKRNPEAVKAAHKRWCTNNPEKKKASDARCRAKNSERVRITNLLWRRANPERARQTRADWAKRNPEKTKLSGRKWRQNNLHVICAKQARRRALLRSKLESSHDLRIERTLYTSAKRISDCLKTPHHVDHILPLASGGPHHHTNLQVLPASWNLKKNCRAYYPLPEGYKVPLTSVSG